MKNLKTADIIASIGGELIKGNPDELFDNVTTIPKGIRDKTLYIDLYKTLMADFKAISKNKPFVAVTENPGRFENLGGNVVVIKVKNIVNAYWNFVDYYRSQFNIPVIGVTGTCGKTTTKEMIKHILSSKYNNIVATYKSRNQRPYNLEYMLKIDDSTQIADMEMGVTYPQDLSIYCRYFKPQIGVVTNIGVDHLAHCGTPENYIKAKSRLLDGMGNKGTLILNMDSENIQKINLSNFKGKIIYYGFNNQADFEGCDLKRTEKGIEFSLKCRNKNYEVFIPVSGDFNAYNALAAIAAAHEAGIEIDEAIEKLKSFKNIEKHFEIRNGIKGSIIIDDTWSTNPTSAEAALRMLKNYSEGKKTVAILGRMNLLGKYSTEFHRQIGKKTAEFGIDYLVTTDNTSKDIGNAALENGISAEHIYCCSNLNEIMYVLNNLLDKNTVVLVKVSMLDSYQDLMDKLIIKNS